MTPLERRVLRAWWDLYEATAGNVNVAAWQVSAEGDASDRGYYVDVQLVYGGQKKQWRTPDYWVAQAYEEHLANVRSALDACLHFVRKWTSANREALYSAVTLVKVTYTSTDWAGHEETRVFGVYGSRKEASQAIYPEYCALRSNGARNPYSVPARWSFEIDPSP